ncbi:MAG: hypothetical protein HQK76_18525 [Desulfobacterales bacterium]|nr:hypothetical protein [Desulfobacterales bacterium]
MAFEPDKDVVLKKWRCEETGLLVSINQYNKGQAKLQIGPRIVMKKDGTEGAPLKAGRLSLEDVEWMSSILDEIKSEMTNYNK